MNIKMPTRLELTTLTDGTEISTVNLQSAAFGGMQYETCIFYSNGGSNVVGRWATKEEALEKHRWLVEHERAHERMQQKFPRVFPGL